ncbi:MAG: hypothetical protein M3Z75_03555 [Actinomycetota bacterium]|nr:hypothetical protein [Actinomycetota bacterium]
MLRSWNRRDGVHQEILPGEPVPALTGQAITASMPVPYDGALLGWVTGSQVTALLTVHCRQPRTWDDPVPVPEIQVMPMAGTSDLLHWPPFTASPLRDERLWEYAERDQIVDLAPLVTRSTGCVFWVPSPERGNTRHEIGCVVITGNLPAPQYWLPAGVYLDHWTLSEGIPAPAAGRLLALPAAVDLADKLRRAGGPGRHRRPTSAAAGSSTG